ncbi:MAG: ComEC/Rec2 family competence protein [Armatimonadota bacterium]
MCRDAGRRLAGRLTLPRDRRTLLLAAAVAATAAVWVYALLPGGQYLELTVLDVGEGLCAVVRTPAGRAMVVDCGTSSWRDSESVGARLVAPYLQSRGIDVIDVAVLTHPHADHVIGYAGLLEAKPARLVLDIGQRSRSPHYKRFLRAAKACQATYRIARRGQSIDMGSGVTVQILNPDPARHYEDLNNKSVALRIVFKRVAFLLAGDTEGPAERYMLQSKMPLRSEVLQVGHHGSDAGTTSEWLAAVRPRIAVISCGRGNHYGHPSRDVIRRLVQRGILVYRTDKDGAICVTTDGRAIGVRRFGR